MIFVGDIALPAPDMIDEDSVAKISEIFSDHVVVGNLEGSVCKHCDEYLAKPAVFNAETAITTLKRWNIRAVSLANNHIFDIPNSLNVTKKVLDDHNIASFGAGKNIACASKPAELTINQQSVVMVGFGWEAIQCSPASKSGGGVNPLQYKYVIEQVKKIKIDYPDHLLIVMMHWNYELEHYPQPAERMLAKKCIDLGANAIIGGHCHLVQGIEIYKNAPIVYSLGNWAFIQGIYFEGKLRFPSKTDLQLALEWDFKNEPVCHWFSYHSEGYKIKYLESELLSDSQKIREFTPFNNMDDKTYLKWFRKHRVKKKFLPIFKNIYSGQVNKLKVNYIKMRGRAVDLMLKLKLKKIKNN